MSLDEKPRRLPTTSSPPALEADIAVTRARFGQGLSDLRHKLTPAGLVQEAQALFLDASLPRHAYVRQVPRGNANRQVYLRRGIVLLALAGAATAWLLVRSSKARNKA